MDANSTVVDLKGSTVNKYAILGFEMTLLALALLLGLLCMGENSYAVMRPDIAARELGVPNHLLRKNLGQFFAEAQSELSGLNFRVPPKEFSVYPYKRYANMDVGEENNVILNAQFLAIFHDLPSEKWIQYHNIFFGYDESQIKWGLKPASKTSQISRLFQVEHDKKGNFTIFLPESFKREPRLQRLAKLMALMRLDFEQQLIERFGGWTVYREFYEKVLWVGNLYSMSVIRKLMARLNPEELNSEIFRFSKEEPTGEIVELQVLNSSLMVDLISQWMGYMLETRQPEIGPYSEQLVDLLGVLNQQYLDPIAEKRTWTLEDNLELLNRQQQSLKRWWHSPHINPSRFRILHMVGEMKDSLLDLVIREDSIYQARCDVLLRTSGSENNETVH